MNQELSELGDFSGDFSPKMGIFVRSAYRIRTSKPPRLSVRRVSSHSRFCAQNGPPTHTPRQFRDRVGCFLGDFS